EVERLRARGEGVVERDVDPLDLALREAELPRDRIGDGALVALAAPRVADLPRLVRGSPEPRREGGVVGADRQDAGVDQLEVGLVAARGGGGAACAGGGLLARSAAGRNCREQGDEKRSDAHP